MSKNIVLRTRLGWIATVCLVSACGPETGLEESPTDLADETSALSSDNGLSVNGLSTNGMSVNGLSGNGLSGNGLSSNGLSSNGLSSNGLSTTTFKAWFDSGANNATSHAYAAAIMKYVVRCACPSTVTRTFTDPATGTAYSWVGNLGLAPNWCNGTKATVADQEWVSACLLAHVNALANPTNPNPDLSVLISVKEGSAEVNLPVSAGEAKVMAVPEGVYFGNVFGDATSTKKGSYLGRARGSNVPVTGYENFGLIANVVAASRAYGRRCWMNACPDLNAGMTFAGEGPVGWAMDEYLDQSQYSVSLGCTTDAQCASINQGLTPICRPYSSTSTIKFCAARSSRCTGNPASSCLDPTGRSWTRVLGMSLGIFLDPNNNVRGLGASVVSTPGYMTGVAISGLSNGGWVKYGYKFASSTAVTTGHTVTFDYSGNGSLKLEARTSNYSAYTNYGTKNLTCAPGKWCKAVWTGVTFGYGTSSVSSLNSILLTGVGTAPTVGFGTLGL